MQVGHLVCRVDHFELVISRIGDSTPKLREVIPIYPTPTKYQQTFCPVSILSSYCKARNELCKAEDNDFLFPKMSSSLEKGTDRHILAIATPHECIPASSFKKKFRSHVESEELKKFRVNPLEFTSDSLKLGGAKTALSMEW